MATKNASPICTLQVGCDGETLHGPRRQVGFCGRCAEALERKKKVIPPKGVNTAVPDYLREIDRKKAEQ